MDPMLSSIETQRRELILKREIVDADFSSEDLRSKTIESLRNMPIASVLEIIGSKFTLEEKNEIYNLITDSSFLKNQSGIVRAWVQLRVQDYIERGHLPSTVEILIMNKVLGKEISGAIFLKAIEVYKELDAETKEYIQDPKNEIESIIFEAIKGKCD
jgi:hypothetical protein